MQPTKRAPLWQRLAAALRRVDAADAHVYGGTALVAAGIWGLAGVWWACIAAGCAVAALGLAALIPRGGK